MKVVITFPYLVGQRKRVPFDFLYMPCSKNSHDVPISSRIEEESLGRDVEAAWCTLSPFMALA